MANTTKILTASDSSSVSWTTVKSQYDYEEIAADMQNPASLIPTTLPITSKYRGPSSSSDYNTFTRSVFTDIANVFNAQQQLLSDAAIANEVILQQYNAVDQQVADLEAELQALQQTVANLQTLKAKGNTLAGITLVQSLFNVQLSYGGYPSYYPSTSPLSADQRAEYSGKYGQIIPSMAQAPQSKTYLVDTITGTNVFPPGVLAVTNVKSSPSASTFAVDENDISLGVDADETTFYRRNIYYAASQNIQYVDVTYTLTIPEQFVNDLTCNYFIVHPYPEFGVEILSVVAHGVPGSQDQQLLPVDNSGNIIPIISAGKTRLTFPAQDVVSVDFTLRQTQGNPNLRPGLQAFTTGVSVADVGYISFASSSSRTLIPFTLSNNFFKSVISVAPTVPGVTYNLWYLNGSGDIQQTSIGAILSGLINQLFVEVVLSPSLGAFPVIDQLSLQFQPVYSS